MGSTWESIEERERRIRGSRTTSRMTRAAEEAPAGKTLQDAFATRTFITRNDLRRIAEQTYSRPVFSLYLNFSPDRLLPADRPTYLSVFRSMRHEALESRKAFIESLPHQQRAGLAPDLTEIQQFLDGYRPEGARALVIFKSGQQLNIVLPLPVRVAEHLIIDGDPYVEPLEAILEAEQRVLVLDVARDRTTASLFELGFEFPVESIKEDLPRETHEAFREGKTERHRETHVVWHFKASAEMADRLFRETRSDLLILIGEDATVSAFEDYLPKALAQRLIARLQLAKDADPNERRSALESILMQRRAAAEEAALSELGLYQDRQRLAAGTQMVVNAGNLFLMRQLYVRDDLSGSGFICHTHHFLSLKAGSCPFDGQPLQQTEQLLDELIEMARLHGVDVMVVSEHKEGLDKYHGIAAILVAPLPADELRTAELTS